MLQSRTSGGDRVLAFPDAQIGITGPEAAFAILHGKEHLTHRDPASFRKESLASLRSVSLDARAAERAGIVDKVIEPRETRQELLRALTDVGDRPRRDRHPRRHPNLPF